MLRLNYPSGSQPAAAVLPALPAGAHIPPGTPAAAPATARSAARHYLRDGACIASSTTLQAGAFLWTYRHHTPALSHVVAAAAVSKMLWPLVRMTVHHLRGESAPQPATSPIGWRHAVGPTLEAGRFVFEAAWGGVSYGLGFGALSAQLGVVSVWGPPLAVGVVVLGATCAVALTVYWLLPPAPRLVVDTAAVATLARLSLAAGAYWFASDIDTSRPQASGHSGSQTDVQSESAKATQRVVDHVCKMADQSLRDMADWDLWRNELIVGTALGVWQGTQWAQGHIGARGAMTGVGLLFPLATAVFRPLSQGIANPQAQSHNRAMLTCDNQAHHVAQSAMRLVLMGALWAAPRAV